MSDCALAIANAVADVYATSEEPMHHYWCLFHVLKAFKGKAKTYLKDRWIEAFNQFWNIVYSQHNPMPALTTFKLQWAEVSPGFGEYVKRQWVGRIRNWAIFFQTNSYLPPPERLQIDEVVQVLTNEVESHYRWSQHQVKSGFAGQTTNKFQMRQKLIADAHTLEDMEMLGVFCESITGGVRRSSLTNENGHLTDPRCIMQYIISSFTNPNAMQYTVKTSMVTLTCKMQLTSCSCPHFTRFGSACKHLYYINRTHGIPVVEQAVLPLPVGSSNSLPPGRLDRSQIDLTVEDSETEAQDDNSDIKVLKSTLPSGKVIEVYRPPQRPKRLFGRDSSTDEPVLKRPRATNTPTNDI
ncbi:hypothetical protein PCANC_13326 [Puccinia coronata f. sp. avenae]|uniref:SWIM-type domain-containing protein n=1 Tax=Puccinia coronata f. sp. avenae TaxID=200324 RepID=A0A2N5SZL5_9BASI|nr:hypothetical protein PCANC_13326 [Puccinia coronata f. sp. avenae]